MHQFKDTCPYGPQKLFFTLQKGRRGVADATTGMLSQWFRKAARRIFTNELTPDAECKILQQALSTGFFQCLVVSHGLLLD